MVNRVNIVAYYAALRSVGGKPHASKDHKENLQEEEKVQKAAPQTERTEHETKTAAKPKSEDDDFDVFAPEDDEEEKAREARIQAIADEQAAKRAASGKEKPVLKSVVILDVKPWEDTTDLVEMEKRVRAIDLNGLEWKASKLVEIGYGIKKLQISCHVVDELVSVDDIQDKIIEFEDLVQSTDVVQFTKL